jgi:hypothetical protein
LPRRPAGQDVPGRYAPAAGLVVTPSSSSSTRLAPAPRAGPHARPRDPGPGGRVPWRAGRRGGHHAGLPRPLRGTADHPGKPSAIPRSGPRTRTRRDRGCLDDAIQWGHHHLRPAHARHAAARLTPVLACQASRHPPPGHLAIILQSSGTTPRPDGVHPDQPRPEACAEHPVLHTVRQQTPTVTWSYRTAGRRAAIKGSSCLRPSRRSRLRWPTSRFLYKPRLR